MASRPRIAVVAGPTATVLNTPPLRTSTEAGGAPLRAQRLAAPVTVYVEQFSAHPLERDAADLYGSPDGYVGADGVLRPAPSGPADVGAYAVRLRPEDGLYLLPYPARTADGSPWEDDGVGRAPGRERARQPFLPDASRLFEEIDRFGLDADGRSGILSRKADFEFLRAGAPGGYLAGLRAADRTDHGDGDVQPEVDGEDFFPYRPRHLRREPGRALLARITATLQGAADSGRYDGLIWLEGSPFLEETLYWLGLVLDTCLPVVGVASPDWAHGVVGNVGDRNVIDAVSYIASRAWADERGRDRLGAVLVHAGRVLPAREAQKADARGAAYTTTGGLGGPLGAVSQAGAVSLGFVPVRAATRRSEVALGRLPATVDGVRITGGALEPVTVSTRDAAGGLLAGALPRVAIVKYGRYMADGSSLEPDGEVEVLARLARGLEEGALIGFVAEGGSPHGHLSGPLEAALARAVASGAPVVKVGRGNADGHVPGERVRLAGRPLAIAGQNLTSTKARMLLTAALLRFGALPPARDPDRPTAEEEASLRARIDAYQAVFDVH